MSHRYKRAPTGFDQLQEVILALDAEMREGKHWTAYSNVLRS